LRPLTLVPFGGLGISLLAIIGLLWS
jgi:hypothetical protein